MWFAAANIRDSRNDLAKRLFQVIADEQLVTTDHVVVETWLGLNARIHRHVAGTFWRNIRDGAARVELVTLSDLDTAWAIGESFPDQDFSIVDRTSFAVMERLGIRRAASFDDHFAIYRYGRNRDRAFEIMR